MKANFNLWLIRGQAIAMNSLQRSDVAKPRVAPWVRNASMLPTPKRLDRRDRTLSGVGIHRPSVAQGARPTRETLSFETSLRWSENALDTGNRVVANEI